MRPFRFGRLPPWSYGQHTSTLSGVALLRWMVRLSLTASGAFMLTNRTQANSETTTCSAFDVRIYGGETSFDGALLIQDASGHWRRLCFGVTVDILFLSGAEAATRVAEVVCRQVGFPQPKASAVFYKYNSETLRENYTDFLFYYPLRCGGHESHLSQCHPYNMEFKESDTKDYQIRDECYYGVACKDDNRLTVSVVPDEWTRNITAAINSTGFVRASGLLNAKAYGWIGRVCAYFYDSVNWARIAQTSCRQMGYRAGFAMRAAIPDDEDSSLPFAIVNGSQPSRNCLMPETKCSGEELSISQCEHKQVWGSFSPGLMFEPKWPGYPVPIGCTDSTFEVSTGLLLNSNSSTPNGVFITYGTMWLPVINSTDPHTCTAVCKSLHKQRQTKAVCHQEVLDERVLSTTERYAASIHCSHDEVDVGRCAHHLELLIDDHSSNQNDHTRPQHLQVLCLEQQEHELYSIELNVVADARVTHSGCLVANINGTVRNVFATREEERQIVAQLACKNYHPKRNLTSAFATLANYFLPEDGQWQGFSQAFACREPSVIIGCGSNNSSASHCTYNMRNWNPNLTWIFRQSLMVFCAYGTLELHLTANFTPYEGRLEFRFENGRTFVDIEGWNDAAAAVACRQLGYGNEPSRRIKKVLAHRGMEWVMTNIKCKGTEEHLTACTHQWMAIPVRFGINVAGVICRATASRLKTILVNGDSNSGHVAIKRDSDSVYICADSNPDDSPRHRDFLGQVGILLCRNAGFLRVKNAERLNFDSTEQLPDSTLAFKNFVCRDADSLLEECTHDGAVELASCTNDDSITQMGQQRVLALRCDEYEFGTMVRLVGGNTPFEGHVEVMYKGQWGAVCDDRLDTDASTVICRQLFGSESTGHPVHGSKFATKNERFLLDEVRCSSEAKSLAHCTHNQWGDHDCGPCEQAGVVCLGVSFIHQPTVSFKGNGAKPRLVCTAEGFPSPSYQWFIAGATVSVSGDSIDIRCNDSETIVYICNAYNAAGEQFIQVTIDKKLGCIRYMSDTLEYSAQVDGRVMTPMAVGLCLSTLGFIGVLLYALSLRRVLTKATRSEKDMSCSVAYSTMNLTNEST